jgi:diguanylate cyclase (GGDEF)-like protein
MTPHPARAMRFVLIVLLAVAATPIFAAFDSASNLSAQNLVQGWQSDWNAVRPTPMVTLAIRKAAGSLMLVPAVTLFLLYLFRPRPYVLAGVTMWLAGSVMMLVLSFNSGAHVAPGPQQVSVGRLAVCVWALAALVLGAGLRFASAWFREPAVISRGFTWSFVAAVAYTVFAAIYLPPPAVAGPAYVLMSAWMAIGAATYLHRARRDRMVGLLLTGSGAAGMVIVNSIALAAVIASGGIGAAPANVASFNLVCASLLLLGMHLLIFEDVIQELRLAAAELAASRDEMKAMAVTDPLTRCYNRRLLYEIAEHELQTHRRYNLPLSLLYMDIDHFKAINDTRGHQTGDEVLKTLGTILRELTRQADYVFRWGGDEFLVLLSAAEPEARTKAQQIRKAFLESAIVGDLPDGVDVSIGTVAVPVDTEDFDPLIDQADREMYRRKRALAS